MFLHLQLCLQITRRWRTSLTLRLKESWVKYQSTSLTLTAKREGPSATENSLLSRFFKSQHHSNWSALSSYWYYSGTAPLEGHLLWPTQIFPHFEILTRHLCPLLRINVSYCVLYSEVVREVWLITYSNYEVFFPAVPYANSGKSLNKKTVSQQWK